MVRAWYMDADSSVDQCKPHQTDPLQPVTLEELAKLGVLYFKIEGASNCDWDKHEVLSKIRKERGYTYEDAITCSREKMPDLDEKLVSFFTEHIHSDEEIRLITEGSGYFDARDTNDRWIRIEVVANDMIILPAGIYHRFTLDEKHYIQARRYFVGEPVWTPVNRPADDHQSRLAYLKTHGSA